MRKLASIQKINDIRPIPGADSIEVARVLGWDVVVKKNEFHVGDEIVYIEIDSFLPIEDEYEFLRKTSYKNDKFLGEGFRLKTIKLRGQVSQGLILPISVVENKGWHGLPVGTDVTEILGIKKWEVPETAGLGGDVAGRRPGWVEHSDETRVQSDTSLIEKFAGLEYYITTKYDGSSHFVAIDDENVFRAGSHNMELKETDKPGTFWAWLKENNIPEKLLSLKEELNAKRLYIIGEWCGEGIQKNRLNLRKPQWFPFTVNVDGKRLGLAGLEDVCRKLDIPHVEVEEVGFDLPSKYPTVDALLERAGKNITHAYNGEQEGIVIRPVNGYYVPKIETPYGIKEGTPEILSMKVINNKYLLKNKD